MDPTFEGGGQNPSVGASTLILHAAGTNQPGNIPLKSYSGVTRKELGEWNLRLFGGPLVQLMEPEKRNNDA